MELSMLLLAFASLFASTNCRSPLSYSPGCNKLFDFMVSAFAELKTGDPEAYVSFGEDLGKTMGVDIEDYRALRGWACRIAHIKTISEFCDMFRIKQSECVLGYRRLQKGLASVGGYTNMVRLYWANWDFYNMLITYTRDVENATRVRDVIDLPTLTQFFEVMQVKYGSRWFSMVFQAPHQKILINDVKKFASDMYESNNAEEFANKQKGSMELDTFEHYMLSRAYQMFPITHSRMVQILSNYGLLERLMSEAQVLIGDLGLFNLKN